MDLLPKLLAGSICILVIVGLIVLADLIAQHLEN